MIKRIVMMEGGVETLSYFSHQQKRISRQKIVFWRCPAEIMFCFRLLQRDVICCLQMPAKVCASHCCGSSTACVCVCDCPAVSILRIR